MERGRRMQRKSGSEREREERTNTKGGCVNGDGRGWIEQEVAGRSWLYIADPQRKAKGERGRGNE